MNHDPLQPDSDGVPPSDRGNLAAGSSPPPSVMGNGADASDHGAPSSLSEEELIGAYLDGELSGQELAQAEKLLADKPASRQLLEELKGIRQTLRQALRYRLAPDFHERVTLAALRAKEAAREGSDAQESSLGDTLPLRIVSEESTLVDSRGVEAISAGGVARSSDRSPTVAQRFGRRFAYAALAVAAAWAIIWLDPSRAPNAGDPKLASNPDRPQPRLESTDDKLADSKTANSHFADSHLEDRAGGDLADRKGKIAVSDRKEASPSNRDGNGGERFRLELDTRDASRPDSADRAYSEHSDETDLHLGMGKAGTLAADDTLEDKPGGGESLSAGAGISPSQTRVLAAQESEWKESLGVALKLEQDDPDFSMAQEAGAESQLGRLPDRTLMVTYTVKQKSASAEIVEESLRGIGFRVVEEQEGKRSLSRFRLFNDDRTPNADYFAQLQKVSSIASMSATQPGAPGGLGSGMGGAGGGGVGASPETEVEGVPEGAGAAAPEIASNSPDSLGSDEIKANFDAGKPGDSESDSPQSFAPLPAAPRESEPASEPAAEIDSEPRSIGKEPADKDDETDKRFFHGLDVGKEKAAASLDPRDGADAEVANQDTNSLDAEHDLLAEKAQAAEEANLSKGDAKIEDQHEGLSMRQVSIPDDPNARVFVLEGTAEQLDAALAELDALAGADDQVRIDANEADRQGQAWRLRYERGVGAEGDPAGGPRGVPGAKAADGLVEGGFAEGDASHQDFIAGREPSDAVAKSSLTKDDVSKKALVNGILEGEESLPRRGALGDTQEESAKTPSRTTADDTENEVDSASRSRSSKNGRRVRGVESGDLSETDADPNPGDSAANRESNGDGAQVEDKAGEHYKNDEESSTPSAPPGPEEEGAEKLSLKRTERDKDRAPEANGAPEPYETTEPDSANAAAEFAEEPVSERKADLASDSDADRDEKLNRTGGDANKNYVDGASDPGSVGDEIERGRETSSSKGEPRSVDQRNSASGRPANSRGGREATGELEKAMNRPSRASGTAAPRYRAILVIRSNLPVTAGDAAESSGSPPTDSPDSESLKWLPGEVPSEPAPP